jgi:uncharacterized membrane protein YdjX (TVP38/TMEM64 family)
MPKAPKLTYSLLFSIYTGIMPVIMSGFVTFWLYNHVGTLESFSTFYWILAGFGAVLAMGLSIIPTSYVALVAGYFFGWSSIPFLLISYILATCIGFIISKKIDNQRIIIEIKKNKKANAVLEKLQSDQFKIVALARLSPVFPFGISNVIFTYLGVPLQRILVAGIIGMMPRSIFMVWLASQSESLQKAFAYNWRQYIQSPIFLIGLASAVAFFYLVYRAYKKA